MLSLRWGKLVGAVLSAMCCAAGAQIAVNNTRLVFLAGSKQVEFVITNESKQLQTLRAWVDTGDGDIAPDDTPAPFFVMPPVSKIQAGGKQTLRISFTGDSLPNGQESLFYLNLLNLAPVPEKKEGENFMRFDARSRFKLFFRPTALPGDPLTAAQQLAWRLDPAERPTRLTANNPSPYFLTLIRVRLMHGPDLVQELDSAMASPFGSATFALAPQGTALGGALSVHYRYIDDYGLYRDCVAALNTGR